MIKIIKREDYSSEEDYQKAYEEMCKAVNKHNKIHSSISDYEIMEKIKNKIKKDDK